MLIAKGNVTFTNGGTSDLGRLARVQHETKLGTFHHASGSATKGQPETEDHEPLAGPQEPEIFFYGETLEKIGEQEIQDHQGRLHDLRAADAAVGDHVGHGRC